MELVLFFTMSGLNIVLKDGADVIKLDGAAKTLPEFIDTMKKGGARLLACSAAFPIVGCTEADLIDGVECQGVATFVAEAEEADVVLTF
jgi:predicted peroxiredoxin